MKVFISWSGEKSRAVAGALREWLPLVINSVEPFVSDTDIHAGTRWQAEIAEQLDATNVGIVCVTRENQHAPWLNFEAGALAKALDSARVIPFVVDLKPSDVDPPLGQFQAQPATQPGVLSMLRSINTASDAQLNDELLLRAAAKWWPDLEAELVAIQDRFVPRSHPVDRAPARTDRELLEELLDTVRSLARSSRDVMPTVLDDEPPQIVEELVDLLRGWSPTVRVRQKDRRAIVRTTRPLPADLRTSAGEVGMLNGYKVSFVTDRDESVSA